MNVHVCMNIMSVLRMHIYGVYICMYRKSKICVEKENWWWENAERINKIFFVVVGFMILFC